MLDRAGRKTKLVYLFISCTTIYHGNAAFPRAMTPPLVEPRASATAAKNRSVTDNAAAAPARARLRAVV
jgi:hypothetical protein